MTSILNLTYFFRRKVIPGFRIKNNALVLDIGSGDKPFWRADVFVDDLSLGDVQRASETNTIHDIGIFVNANVNKMPFKDKFFDFSFCSHLLEHVENPKKAIDEIVRVSKSGYIEMPNGIIETVQPFVSHLWFVYRNKNKLVFVRKSRKIHDVLMHNDINRSFFSTINKSPDPFIRLYWKGKIDYEVIDHTEINEKYEVSLKLKKSKKTINFYIYLIKTLRFLFYRRKIFKMVYK